MQTLRTLRRLFIHAEKIENKTPDTASQPQFNLNFNKNLFMNFSLKFLSKLIEIY